MGLLDGILNSIGVSSKPQSSGVLAGLAQGNEPTAPGLAILQRGQAANAATNEAAQKDVLIKDMASKLQSKDYQGALAAYSQLDPEGVKALLPQISKIDPAFAGTLNEAETTGTIAGETKYGTNKRQMLEREIEAGKYSKDNPKEDRLGRQFTQSQIRQYQKEYNQAAKNVEEQLNTLGGLDSFASLATTNPAAAAQVGVKVAKAMGEVGALSESDVTRYVGNKAIADNVANEVIKLSKGTLNPKQAKYLQESLKAIAAIAADRDSFLKAKYARQVANNLEVTPEEAQYKLGFTAERGGSTTNPNAGKEVVNKKTGKRGIIQPDGSIKEL